MAVFAYIVLVINHAAIAMAATTMLLGGAWAFTLVASVPLVTTAAVGRWCYATRE